MTRSLTVALLTLPLLACRGRAPPTGGNVMEPVPALNERALIDCTYERVGDVAEERTGVVVDPQREMRRLLGLKARSLNADAIIEVKIASAAQPATGVGSTSMRTVRGQAVAIRFTSPNCRWDRRAR